VLGDRIYRRMQLRQVYHVSDYLKLIQSEPDELTALINAFLVNIVSFFRRKDRFHYLKSELAPALLRGGKDLRIWSVGCSTGEEAYSFAMVLLEEVSRLDISPDIKILATDLHGPSLEKAREGLFSFEIEEEVSAERLHRFFVREKEGYRIVREISDMVEFSHYNYLSDPPLDNIDIITCTEVFSHITEQSALTLLDFFHYALNDEGRLLVDSEKFTAGSALFRRQNQKVAAYRKNTELPAGTAESPEADKGQPWHDNAPAMLDTLFNYTEEGMCLIRMIFDDEDNPVDYLFVQVNTAFETLTGLHDAKGKTIRQLAPDHEEHWFRIYGRIARSGKSERFENKAEQLGQRWYEVHAFPVGEQTSQMVGVIFKDITIRKQTEKALVESEGRYRELFEAMEEGFCVMEILFDENRIAYDYKFLEVNPAFYKQTGLKNAVGKTALELIPNLEKHWIETYGEIALTGERLRFEQGSDAMGRWFEVEAFRIGGPDRAKVALLFTDITKRIKVEKALKDSEERFRNFANTAPALLWVTNPQGECTFISDGWFEMTGVPCEKALVYGWIDNIHPDDSEAIKKEFLEHNLRQEPFRLEYRLLTKSNEYHWVIDAGKPYRDDEGNFLGYVGSIIDINNRKKSEEALRKNEIMLTATLDQLPVGVSISSAPNGNLLFQNKAAKEILGHKLIETQDINGYSQYHALHKDGTPLKAREYPLVKALRGITTRQQEILYRKAGGNLITLIVNSAPIRDENNNITRAVSAFQDITELRRAREAVMLNEAHLKLIMESATDYAIFTLDLDLCITDWNSGAEQILGYKRDEVIGKAGNIIHVPEEKDDELENKVEIARREGKVESEGWYLRKNGSRFYGRGTVMPLRVKGEDLMGYLKIMTDYSERREMEDALRRAKDEAERASFAKDEFLAHMSHEIRTPLNAIIGLSNLLVHRNQEGSLTDDLQTVKFSADNLRMLVDDILDFSKIQAGKVEIESTVVDLKYLLHSLEKTHSLRAREQKNRLELDVSDDIPDIILTDSLRLSQVMNNLLSNAIKFTDRGVVRIEVNLHKREGNRAWLNFEVQDTGCGIPEEKQELIFEKFIQADISTVRKYGGTGLGLSITKLLLELMNSRIKVRSTVGEGSAFYFTLPVEVPEQEVVMAEDDVLSLEELGDKKLKILIVEDSEVNRLVLLQFFDLWGEFSADEASNGEEALEMTQKTTYDLILMDLRMPVMDGYQAAKEIRSQQDNPNAHVPIVALTADTPGELKKKPEAQNFTDVLTKPFDPDDLRAKILRATTRQSLGADQSFTRSGSQPRNSGKLAENISAPDMNKVTELFQGNVTGITRLIKSTLSDFEVFSAEHSEAMDSRDLNTMQELLHKRKPMLDLLGLHYVGERLTRVRDMISKGVSDAELEELKVGVEKLLSNVITQVNDKLCQYSGQD
ncbi:MAG: PAS domain S-box protein, partial [Cyclobacteriaceae bacterium]